MPKICAMQNRFTLASRTRRLRARLWDLLFCWGPAGLGWLGFIVTISSDSHAVSEDWMLIFFCLAMLTSLVLALFNLLQFLRTGQTWGKKRLGLLVISNTGQRMAAGGLLWRCLSTFVLAMVPLVGLITYFDSLFIFSESRRCLHDHLASSQVVDFDSYEEPRAEGTGLNPSEIGFSRFS